MIYIKLTDDMCLQITHSEPVYCGDNLCRTLCFLIDTSYVGEIPMDGAIVTLSYILPNGSYHTMDLTLEDETYGNSFLQYTIPISADLTQFHGDIQMWLQIHTPDDVQIGNTGTCVLRVREVKKYRRPRKQTTPERGE